ncbi:MAG: hypothetical protein WC473_04085 [Patescibacteria group bacterium]|jgi:hypothetical protein
MGYFSILVVIAVLSVLFGWALHAYSELNHLESKKRKRAETLVWLKAVLPEIKKGEKQYSYLFLREDKMDPLGIFEEELGLKPGELEKYCDAGFERDEIFDILIPELEEGALDYDERLRGLYETIKRYSPLLDDLLPSEDQVKKYELAGRMERRRLAVVAVIDADDQMRMAVAKLYEVLASFSQKEIGELGLGISDGVLLERMKAYLE